MADFKQKIEYIDTRINEIDEKMKKLLLQKKDYERQKKELQEQEILNAVKSSGITIETVSDDLALIRLLKENNFTKEDILELVSPQVFVETRQNTSQQILQNNYNGGIQNENK